MEDGRRKLVVSLAGSLVLSGATPAFGSEGLPQDVTTSAADDAVRETTPKSKKETRDWSIELKGRLHYDVGVVETDVPIAGNEGGTPNEIRRARLGIEGDMPGGLGYRIALEFANDDPEFADAYITYEDGGLTLTAGQQNNFQSLEELTSSNNASTIERAAFTDAFNFQRHLGFSAQFADGPMLLQAGVFTDNTSDFAEPASGHSLGFDGRVVFAPKLQHAQLHFAASGHWLDPADEGSARRYRQRPLIHASPVRIIDTKTIENIDTQLDYGLEALLISGRLHIASELHWLDVKRSVSTNPGFFGCYAEVGYFLVGDGYRYGDGILRGPKVGSPIGKGGVGAIAANLRYDHLDLVDVDAAVVGGVQDGVITGLSWWPTENLRLLADYAHLEYRNAAIAGPNGERNYAADVLAMRFQITF